MKTEGNKPVTRRNGETPSKLAGISDVKST